MLLFSEGAGGSDELLEEAGLPQRFKKEEFKEEEVCCVPSSLMFGSTDAGVRGKFASEAKGAPGDGPPEGADAAAAGEGVPPLRNERGLRSGMVSQ